MKKLKLWLIPLVSLLACQGGPYQFFVVQPLPPIQAGTMAQNWSNGPTQGQIDVMKTYDYVTLSPRAQLAGGPVAGSGAGSNAAEQLIAAGVKVLFATFPCYTHYLNQPLPAGDQEGDIERLAIAHNAVLHNGDGSIHEAYGCFSVDFRNRTFVNALVKYWEQKAKIAKGILLHESCGFLPPSDSNDYFYTPAGTQAELDWEDGYHYYVSELRKARPDWEVIAVCDRWSEGTPGGKWRDDMLDGLFLENFASGLNPVADKSFNTLNTNGSRNVVAMYDTTNTYYTKNYRRGAAAMAIALDALFLFGEEASVTPDMEHFQFDYGTFSGLLTQLSNVGGGVWERIGTRGLVVLNISGIPYDYVYSGTTYTLSSPDGLSIQFKDSNDQPMVIKTNYNQ